MNHVQFHHLKSGPRGELRFDVSSFKNPVDQTLVLGLDSPSILLHVWLNTGLVHRARMNLHSGTFYNDFSGSALSYNLLIPERLAFTESTDYEFACLLKTHRFEPIYREVNLSAGERRLTQFEPFHAPTNEEEAKLIPDLAEMYR